MTADQLKKLEADLWEAADQLRANSKLTATEYSMPVLGLIFLRQASNNFDRVKIELEATLPVRAGKRMPLSKEMFLERSTLYLPKTAHYDYIAQLPKGSDIGAAIDTAMRDIEAEHEPLSGVLPKTYTLFEKDLLEAIIRIFNKEALKNATGDVFGKIYEYFLNEFAKKGAQEGGEFFTPMSLVSTIVNFIEPEHGTVFDPACGSAGMFVQSGYFMERLNKNPNKVVTFFGQEKTGTNTNIAKMNMAVHGLEGLILEGNSFYEDKHDLVGKCDFVMANPPFNVDKVDKERDVVKKDPRLPFGLPKNDNANYLWIQYFYSYLNPAGRAGFVMASSASDAGHSEKLIREQLVKTGAVDIMVSIGNNFFYTRSLPCTLWFYDRSKEKNKDRRDQILMLDARKVYRKVTTTINDFSPEQMENLTAIVKMYRGDNKYVHAILKARMFAFEEGLQQGVIALQHEAETLAAVETAMAEIHKAVAVEDVDAYAAETTVIHELLNSQLENLQTLEGLFADIHETMTSLHKMFGDPQNRHNAVHNLWIIADTFLHEHKALIHQVQVTYKKLYSLWKAVEVKHVLRKHKVMVEKKVLNGLDQLETTHYTQSDAWKHAVHLAYETGWMCKKFTDGVYKDVNGLCKLVSQQEVADKDYSLSPGRYVGVDTSSADDADYEERLQQIHLELEELNAEAVELAQTISENYREVML
jgi:type I restriction enzyme M protein